MSGIAGIRRQEPFDAAPPAPSARRQTFTEAPRANWRGQGRSTLAP